MTRGQSDAIPDIAQRVAVMYGCAARSNTNVVQRHLRAFRETTPTAQNDPWLVGGRSRLQCRYGH